MSEINLFKQDVRTQITQPIFPENWIQKHYSKIAYFDAILYLLLIHKNSL